MTPGLEAWRRRTDALFVAIALASLPILLLELKRAELPRSDRLIIDITSVLVLMAFAVDYLVEFSLAQNRPHYLRREWASLGLVLSQMLALFPALGVLGAARALRAGRALRVVATIVRAATVGGLLATDGRQLLRRHAAAIGLSVAGLTWLTSAVAFTLAEDVGADGRVHSFLDALWWSSATITTVGYGDIYPVTGVGRVVGVFTMFVGISSFALVTAKVAEFLVRDRE